VRIWDLSLGKPLFHVLGNHDSAVSAFSYGNDMMYFCCGLDSGNVCIYSADADFIDKKNSIFV